MQSDWIQRRFADLANIADRQARFTFSPFLTEAEYADFCAIQRQLPVPAIAWGGYDDATRVMLRFGDPEALGYELPFPIQCVQIAPIQKKFADDLTHRDFLGAIMHLGLERDELGDLLVGEREAFLFCTETMAEYLCGALTTVKHTTVHVVCVEQPPTDLMERREIGQVQVASPRIDAVVAKIFRLSRADCTNLCRMGHIFVNGRIVAQNSLNLKEGDVISVRGHGKFQYQGITGQTRKGNQIIQYAQFV